MDYDFIKDHALKNIWGAPRQDTQYRVVPNRLTPYHGHVRTTEVLWKKVELPDSTSRWHVYQIGGIHPLAFNLFTKSFGWVSLAEACNRQLMIANVYTAGGVQYPLHDTYYQYTQDRNLILAVKINELIPGDINNEDITLRVYSNAFFNSVRSDGLTKQIHVEGKTLTKASDISDLGAIYTLYSQLPGFTRVFKNGLCFDTFTQANPKVGDSVEVIYDASVKKVVDLKIGDLPVFESSLDQLRKYLVHYSGAGPDTIDYQDDVDVYVYRPGTNDSVYYHKNNEAAMRNLTHRDYSLVTTYIRRYVDQFETLQTPRVTYEPNDFHIKLFIRESGFKRPLVFESNKIHELYKMKDEDVVSAMVGIDSTLSYWQAATLEAAAYTKVMRSPCTEVTPLLAEQAYGYNAIAKYIADTPSQVKTVNNEKVVDVPYKHMFGATAYEYDADGLLLGWHHHYVGPTYVCKNIDTAFVELIAGVGGNVLDEVFGVTNMVLKKNHTYRVFQGTILGGVVGKTFRDVTGDNTLYTITDNNFSWISASPTAYPMIRSDSRFYAEDFELDVSSGGLLKFTLSYMKMTPTGLKRVPLTVPLGQLDIFMNNRGLIRGLDYIVNFPEVYVINKKYLVDPLAAAQKFHVRFTGFAKPNGDLQEEGDYGFIEHNVLSNNNRFDLRDDRVLRIVIDGKLKTRDSLVFSELHSGVSVTGPLNGMPYMVKPLLVPVKSNTTTDTYELRDQALAVDKAISEYLSMKLPQPPRTAPSAITQRYRLFSPFCAKLIMDLRVGALQLPPKTNGFTKQEVADICKPYEYLLKFDPTQPENVQDDQFVLIDPHISNVAVGLDSVAYQFVRQAVDYYCNGKVNIAAAVFVNGS